MKLNLTLDLKYDGLLWEVGVLQLESDLGPSSRPYWRCCAVGATMDDCFRKLASEIKDVRKTLGG